MTAAEAVPRPTPYDVRDLLVPFGGLLVALAVFITQLRMDEPWANGVHLVIALVAAGALLAAGLLGGRVQSARLAGATVLLLAGLGMVVVADLRLLQVLGAEDVEGRGTLTAFFAIVTVVAAAVTARTGSAACLLFTALAGGATLTAGMRWVLDTDSTTAYRVTFVLLALMFAALAASVAAGRHRDVLVDAAGVALLAIGWLSGGVLGFGLGAEETPWAWEGVLLAGGLALAAYCAVTRAPGPGVLAIVVLATFASTAYFGELSSDVELAPSLVGWPLALFVLGLAAIGAAVVAARGRR